jgi:hypothetical protein
MTPASRAPNTGDTNTAIESITASIPTPIMNAFLLPECLTSLGFFLEIFIIVVSGSRTTIG